MQVCLRGSYIHIFKHFKFYAWTSLVSKLAMLWVEPSRVPSSSPPVQRDHVHEVLNRIHVKEEQIDTSLNKTAYCVTSLETDEQHGARQHFGGFMNNMISLYSRDECPFPWQHVGTQYMFTMTKYLQLFEPQFVPRRSDRMSCHFVSIVCAKTNWNQPI
jgi:hypothetical protein